MDVERIFAALTGETDVPSIKAAWVEQHAFSPIAFWCDVHAPKEAMDPLNPYRQHLFDIGQQHQTDVVDESYAGAVHEMFVDEEEGFRRTLELMASGERYIEDMPLICRPAGLEGRPDILVRVDGVPSRLGTFSYRVVEIKSARNIERPHKLQGAVYNRLVGLVQGYEPPVFHVINVESESTAISMAVVAGGLDRTLDQMRQIMAGASVEPCHGAGRWPWESYVNGLAINMNDLSLIPSVGPARRQGLVDAGYRTVGDIAVARETTLSAVKGVGATTARKLVTAATALSRRRPIRRQPDVRIPSAETEVFLDLEGTDTGTGEVGLDIVNYLIGVVVRRRSESGTYRPFFASSPEYERHNLAEFFEWARSLEDALFFHWHHYERTHLTKMASHYSLDPGLVSPVMDRLVDLRPIATESFAFPVRSEGLKEIAKSLGFAWRHDDVTALTSIVLYLSYVDAGGKDEEARQKILDYNEDDCRATMHIRDWLRSQPAR